MKIPSARLAAHLARGPEPRVLIRGDDPLLCDEATEPVRMAARAAGITECRRYSVDGRFDWAAFHGEFQSRSLFSPRSLYELRFQGGKLAAAARQALADLAAGASADAWLIVMAVGLERSSFEGPWMVAFERDGLVVSVDRPEGRALQEWVRARMEARGLSPDPAAVERLIFCHEGNFFGLAQEIDKLALQREPGPVSGDELDELLEDAGHFSIYALADACIAGVPDQAVRILARLRAEGTGPILVLWAVAREARVLLQIACERRRGVPLDRLFAEKKVWAKRRPAVSAALRRLSVDALM
ncbi:MAG: DNA polymerase III subunit delta, partial [Acidiferrobacteraceae bacterium]